MLDVFNKAMGALCPTWIDNVLSTCSDGARNMTGRVRGIVSRIGALSTDTGSTLIRFWCGARQLDIIVKDCIEKYCNEEWFGVLTALIGHLRRQQNLINNMRSKCPKVALRRWLSLGTILKWLAVHRVQIVEYLDEKMPHCTPHFGWWISLLSLRRVTEFLDVLFKELQEKALVVCQQEALFADSFRNLRNLVGLEELLSPSEFDNCSDADSIRKGSFVISTARVRHFIRGLGSREAAFLTTLLIRNASIFVYLLVYLLSVLLTVFVRSNPNATVKTKG
jgi:hypothetical protein